MTSRVVPGMGVTMARLVRVRRLNKVDFPTLGRPTSTTAGRVLGTIEVVSIRRVLPRGFVPTENGGLRQPDPAAARARRFESGWRLDRRRGSVDRLSGSLYDSYRLSMLSGTRA